MFKRHKLIVGVDYGTTYSGMAFVPTQGVDVNDINVIHDWSGGARAHEHLEKVPSQIAYASENQPKISSDAWGYEVDSGLRTYCWTKLLLDKHTLATEHDDPSLQEGSGGAALRVPSGKKAVDVVADFLGHLYQHCMSRLEKTVTADLLKVTPIEFWFTMPAIWSDEAQHATKAAAEKAGFGQRPGDTISMITEPEAAALAAFKTTKDRYDDLLKANTGVLICDCGGGTVDITTYTVRLEEYKGLQLEESCVGVGGKCGATYVDRNLHNLLAQRYGSSFTSLAITKRGPGSTFMKDFESIKKDFDGKSTKNHIIRLIMRDIQEGDFNCVQYDPEEGELNLTYQDMKSLFDPVVDKIIALIAQQVQAVTTEGAPAVENVILVGGFGSSPYLWNRLKQWCDNNGGIRPISPDRPWSAIARGAALRGLEGALVTKRRCRRHYGTCLARQYNHNTDPWDHDVYKNPFNGQMYRRGYMFWQIGKAEKLIPGIRKPLRYNHTVEKGEPLANELILYSCSLDKAPARMDAKVERVGVVKVTFHNVNLKAADKKKKGTWLSSSRTTFYNLHMTLEASMGDDSGVLQFRVMCQGKQCGTAKIEFGRE